MLHEYARTCGRLLDIFDIFYRDPCGRVRLEADEVEWQWLRGSVGYLNLM